MMFKLTLRMTLLACTAAWGVAYGEDTENYGYMKPDIKGKAVATACFGKDGHHTSGWKERGVGGFRSCRGYYTRMLHKSLMRGLAPGQISSCVGFFVD